MREYCCRRGKEICLMATLSPYPVSLLVDYPDRP